MAVDHSHRKLGKKPARHDDQTLQMANYLGVLSAIPTACDLDDQCILSEGLDSLDGL